MSQNVITTEDLELRPMLTLVTTDAPFQVQPDRALIAQLDSKTIVIDFQKAGGDGFSSGRKTRSRLMGRIYEFAVITLISSSALASVYALLTLQH